MWARQSWVGDKITGEINFLTSLCYLLQRNTKEKTEFVFWWKITCDIYSKVVAWHFDFTNVKPDRDGKKRNSSRFHTLFFRLLVFVLCVFLVPCIFFFLTHNYSFCLRGKRWYTLKWNLERKRWVEGVLCTLGHWPRVNWTYWEVLIASWTLNEFSPSSVWKFLTTFGSDFSNKIRCINIVMLIKC